MKPLPMLVAAISRNWNGSGVTRGATLLSVGCAVQRRQLFSVLCLDPGQGLLHRLNPCAGLKVLAMAMAR